MSLISNSKFAALSDKTRKGFAQLDSLEFITIAVGAYQSIKDPLKTSAAEKYMFNKKSKLIIIKSISPAKITNVSIRS